jgi:hypothetical protein
MTIGIPVIESLRLGGVVLSVVGQDDVEREVVEDAGPHVAQAVDVGAYHDDVHAEGPADTSRVPGINTRCTRIPTSRSVMDSRR